LQDRLLGYDGVKSILKASPEEVVGGPVLTMHFRKDDVSLQLFTTIATLGTPHDITLQELRIECFFPMDEDTASTLRKWAAEEPSTRAG
jgi:MmyB-like transcription regulator ligand binding domain